MVLYFDPFAGASGDMILGALVGLGLDPEALSAELAKLNLEGYSIATRKVVRAGLAATKVDVEVREARGERRYPEIRELIEASRLSSQVKRRALETFARLAEAEGRVHDIPPDQVHFHEVGAIDAIVDIVGAAAGFELIGASEILSAPVNVGRGIVTSAHGALPVPAPATAELLRGAPTFVAGPQAELTTPTGAAILTTAARFGPQPPMRVEKISYGAGSRDHQGFPNVLRAMLGKREGEAQRVTLIETNIDDMNPELFGYVLEKLLAAGALDVYLAPVIMKKNRPGTLLTVIARPEQADSLAELIFAETSTIGLRLVEAGRRTLERETISVETRYGPVPGKVSRLAGKVANFAPEYEGCRRLAEKLGVPLKEIYAAAAQAFRETGGR